MYLQQLQCVACCSLLQCATGCCNMGGHVGDDDTRVAAASCALQHPETHCNALQQASPYNVHIGHAETQQRVAVAHCSVLQYATVCCSVLQYATVCCSVLQCVAVCCSVLHLWCVTSKHIDNGHRHVAV